MGDLDHGRDNPIFQGGQALSQGRPAPRHFLTLMPPELRQVGTEFSGRCELAKPIAEPANPLTRGDGQPRLGTTIRLWPRGHYGNFWRTAKRHGPGSCLDYLAAHSSPTAGRSKEASPGPPVTSNFRRSPPRPHPWQRACWRRIPQEPEALGPGSRSGGSTPESVRDHILAVSGRLNPKIDGPSIDPHRGEAKEYRRLFQGPLDGDGRRSIYLKVTRMEGPRFLELFDFPPPSQTRGNRDVTNVPSQALALLNDPFVHEEARVWAERLVARKDDAIDARLTSMFLDALDVRLRSTSLEPWRGFVQRLANEEKVAAADLLASQRVWKDVAHAFFNTKEFLFLR